jgi:hypothetical protein
VATFTKFLDTLPDPNFKIGTAGEENASGTAGQGFASVSLTRPQLGKTEFTISGKAINSTQASDFWKIGLSYNELSKAQFIPIYTFLLEHTKKGFYVVLPTYKLPKNSSYATYVQGNTVTTTESATAGQNYIEITDGTGTPSFGDLFNFIDSTDTLHTKAYMITRVETAADYKTGQQPSGGSIRIHFAPRLQRTVPSGAVVEFDSPKVFVRQQGDVMEYDLGKEGLYQYRLNLEEIGY